MGVRFLAQPVAEGVATPGYIPVGSAGNKVVLLPMIPRIVVTHLPDTFLTFSFHFRSPLPVPLHRVFNLRFRSLLFCCRVFLNLFVISCPLT